METKEYRFSRSDEKLIERIVDDNNTNINHIVLPKGEGLPPHNTNSNVYLIAVRGAAEVRLGGEQKELSSGGVLSIPFDTSMELKNANTEVFEMFIVKAPAPSKAGIK
jgi:quercetin dioxygenase-like cupin family protein